MARLSQIGFKFLMQIGATCCSLEHGTQDIRTSLPVITAMFNRVRSLQSSFTDA